MLFLSLHPLMIPEFQLSDSNLIDDYCYCLPSQALTTSEQQRHRVIIINHDKDSTSRSLNLSTLANKNKEIKQALEKTGKSIL
ncbi:hypothetical protein EOPP23_15970 [Endozoicomonas sp. OPT23]|nr:hypothetical protein [Endozoicomonas sp. OPT23]